METGSRITRTILMYMYVCRQRRIICGMLVFLFLMMLLRVLVNIRIVSVKMKSLQLARQDSFVRIQRNQGRNYVKSKRILTWKPFNNVNQMNMETSCMKECPVKCTLTDNKSDIANVDLVTFELSELWTENWKINTKAIIDFPSDRRPDQIWAVVNLEPPPNLFGNLRVFNGIFNWTVTYRKDATVHLPYGFQTRLNESETATEIKAMATRNFYKEKTGEVTGVVSNCKDTYRRYRFTKELMKHLDIDMFGHCYKKICGDQLKHTSCDNVTSKYKFYLALENSRCKDYVTEKYWWSLRREHIPIVNWDLNAVNENIPIPGSYISISDFDSVKSLADYIKRVSQNETLYNSYFEWKKKYKLTNSCRYCLFCKALHEDRYPQVIEDLDGWVRDDVCDKVEVMNNMKTKLDEFLFWKLGI